MQISIESLERKINFSKPKMQYYRRSIIVLVIILNWILLCIPSLKERNYYLLLRKLFSTCIAKLSKFKVLRLEHVTNSCSGNSATTTSLDK